MMDKVLKTPLTLIAFSYIITEVVLKVFGILQNFSSFATSKNELIIKKLCAKVAPQVTERHKT